MPFFFFNIDYIVYTFFEFFLIILDHLFKIFFFDLKKNFINFLKKLIILVIEILNNKLYIILYLDLISNLTIIVQKYFK